ncbi:glycosyltransferase family 2 protein [Neptunomonas concharum]|uniref:Glycosyltransferase family 2 protein n=1 Tax=Neptunomonas concharum TaxID=1031538 RepID=A0A5P1R8E5_9GAMM|nr:glycosyltransferase family 2 protein [Neptunomonas concharum]QEQ95868.1 hypothetical protein F0U83_03640 [Neptunomonas concharum]
MKEIVKRTAELAKLLKREKPVVGYIEKLDHYSIEGWVIHLQKGVVNIRLTYNNESFELTPQWHQRDDVAEKYGPEYLQAGFSCELPEKISTELKLKEVLPEQLKIIVSDVSLEIVGRMPQPEKVFIDKPIDDKNSLTQHSAIESLGEGRKSNNLIAEENDKLWTLLPQRAKKYQESLIINEDTKKPLLYVNDVWLFSIFGTLVTTKDKNEIEQLLEVKLDNQVKDWKIFINKVISLGTEFAYGVEIEIPGYIWQDIKSNELKINLSFREVKDQSINLSILENDCIDWLETEANWPEGQDGQYNLLLALEHLRYSNFYEKLTLKAKSFFNQYAESMSLSEFLHANHSSVQPLKLEGVSVDVKTRALWSAQKILNKQLLKDNNNLHEEIEIIIKNKKLVGDVKSNFIKSIIPLLAKEQSLHSLNRVHDLKTYYSLAQSDNAWEITIAIAVLIAEKQTNRAIEAMWKLSKMTSAGWLNTECLWFAITQINQLEIEGQATQEQSQRMRYAFLAVLEDFKGEWFSRLHDKMLHKAMIALLQHLPLMTDYKKTDVIKAAIKHYGLSPDFWQFYTDTNINIDDSLFQQAQNQWKVIHQQFNSLNQSASNPTELVKALRFFQKNHNPEAVIFMRELAASLMQNAGADQAVLIELIEDLSQEQDFELVRYVAHPLIQPATEQKLIEKHKTQIYHALRLNTERTSSVTYQAQKTAAQAMRHQASIEQSVVALNNWPAMFLSIDVLVNELLKQPQDIESKLIKLDDVMQHVIAQSKASFYLPAPVCTALSNLSQTKNLHIQNWLAGIKTTLDLKFGEIHNTLFEVKLKKYDITEPGWPQDTLVVIYSCRAYLDTRIKAIRETWVKDLKARAIPYVILVGDGSDEIEGDVLALNVSDTYEDLPQKSLKLFEWVYKNTNAQYVLKIDDDCYLDVDKYFDTLSYRKHHYYGRVIHRPVGGMDRAWHHSKSKTLRAQNAIDKSPEPSVYCDGGGGYTLSRCAMASLGANANTPQGKRLIANSFMEDKLIGDLLSFSYFEPSNEDYECYQRRRTFNTALPVGMYENTFYPSNLTPSRVTHLDTDKDQTLVEEKHIKTELWPKKIWPSCWDISIKGNSNQLELLTDLSKASTLLNNDFFVISVMRNEIIMIKHFLEHYRKLGVKVFIIADNCSDDGTREYLYEQEDVILYSSDTQYKYSHYGVAWQQSILANYCLNKWVLVADADELLVYPDDDKVSIQDFVSISESLGVDCIRTDMIDMYPYGDLNKADFVKEKPFDAANWFDSTPLTEWHIGSGRFSNRSSHVSSLRHRIDPDSEPNAFTSQKYALFKYKPWLRLSQGIHDISGAIVSETPIAFAHFKYHAGFKKKIEDEIARAQHYDGAKEYKRYSAMLAEGSGNFGNKAVSKMYVTFDDLRK